MSDFGYQHNNDWTGEGSFAGELPQEQRKGETLQASAMTVQKTYAYQEQGSFSVSEDEMECESRCCAYNHEGACRFARVHERPPEITENDGCLESSVDPDQLWK